MKLLLVGSRSAQTAASLAALLARDAPPEALFVDGPESPVNGRFGLPPLIRPENSAGVLELAAANGIPATCAPLPQLWQVVEACRPDRVLVSCYPHLISPALLESVTFGWFNVHPSLLPDYRGINPIFWQLRDGRAFIGVTLHRMNSAFDLGPIIDQRTFGLADFPDYIEISRRVGAIGVQLFLEYVDNHGRGLANEESVQNVREGSRQGRPLPADFAVDTGWQARRLVRFVKGVKPLGTPFLETPSGHDLIQDASVAASGRLAMPLPGERLVHCYDGSVVLSILSEERW